jgi:hypothetical protein
MIGDIMGSIKLDFHTNEILHDVIDDTVYHYRRWRISCMPESIWISVESVLLDADLTDCMACIARRQ